jgi:hypothetical protein
MWTVKEKVLDKFYCGTLLDFLTAGTPPGSSVDFVQVAFFTYRILAVPLFLCRQRFPYPP